MKKDALAFIKDDVSGLRMVNKDYFMQLLSDFGAGTKVKITIENYHPQRSLSQNGVLHWYCSELAEEVGMDAEDFKTMMKMKYLRRDALDRNGERMADENGEVMTYIAKTSDLDKKEMALFIDQIRLFGIEFLNYELPLPDANHKIHFLEKRKEKIKNSNDIEIIF